MQRRYHVRVLAGRVDRGAGSHVYHQELVNRLAARGHRVSLVCFNDHPDVAGDITVYTVPRPAPTALPFVWRFDSLRNYWHCSRALTALANLPAPEVVIGGEHLFLKAHAKRFPATPWLYLPHSLLVDQEIRSYHLPKLMEMVMEALYVHLQKWALKRADRTMRFTHMACEAITRRYPGISPRFFVTPMAIDPPVTSGTDVTDGSLTRLLWVGQLIERKRIALALDALARVASTNWTFDVVGDGDQRPALEQQAQRLGLLDRVRFHGFQNDPARFYQRADLVLFPSRLESFGITIVEAMSHGVPCLAMRSDGQRYHGVTQEIITHREDGYLAESDEDFGVLLDALITDPTQLRAVGQRARVCVQSRYTWDRHLDRLEEVFDSITGATWPVDIDEAATPYYARV